MKTKVFTLGLIITGCFFVILMKTFYVYIEYYTYENIKMDMNSNSDMYDALVANTKYIVLQERKYQCRNWEEERDQVAGPLMQETTAPDDSRLIAVIRKYFIDPPSRKLAKMSNALDKTTQAEVVDNILKSKKNGFFIECGALDGERSSNSIFFEKQRQWTGLLIEMDPSYYLQIQGKNRNAFSINACLSPYSYPTMVDFQEHVYGLGKLVPGNKKKSSAIHSVYCFPLYSILLALNQTHIDYFSLDVEGFELAILKSIPFDKLHISVLTVEYLHGEKGGEPYKEYMKTQGYHVHADLDKCRGFCHDYVFVKDNFTI